MEDKQIRELLGYAIEGSILAGAKMLEVYAKENFDVMLKSDNSPLTAADNISNKVISDFLNKTSLPVLSEEGVGIGYDERKDWDYFWLVDPLDGTKEFIKRNGEFTVNIALMEKNTPVAGVIYVPVLNELYIADRSSAFKVQYAETEMDGYGFDQVAEKGISLPVIEQRDKYIVVSSRSHMNSETEDFIKKIKPKYAEIETLSRGSSLKICMVAEGKANIYPRFAPTMEWDTAAGHAIAQAAGCKITRSDGITPLEYNKPNLLNPWFIVEQVGS